jgi:hypothetical protein
VGTELGAMVGATSGVGSTTEGATVGATIGAMLGVLVAALGAVTRPDITGARIGDGSWTGVAVTGTATVVGGMKIGAFALVGIDMGARAGATNGVGTKAGATAGAVTGALLMGVLMIGSVAALGARVGGDRAGAVGTVPFSTKEKETRYADPPLTVAVIV